MTDAYEGFWPGLAKLLKQTFTRQKTPRHEIVTLDIEPGVQISGDDAAIVTLKNHPGFIALQNRKRLKRAALRASLEGRKHTDLNDVNFLVSGLYWLRFDESEVNAAIGNVQTKKPVALAVDEVEEFNRIRSAITSVGATSSEI